MFTGLRNSLAYVAISEKWDDEVLARGVNINPELRSKGLAKAVIYEACKRAKKMGAKRAIVISDMEFYYRIGFKCSSEVYC